MQYNTIYLKKNLMSTYLSDLTLLSFLPYYCWHLTQKKEKRILHYNSIKELNIILIIDILFVITAEPVHRGCVEMQQYEDRNK